MIKEQFVDNVLCRDLYKFDYMTRMLRSPGYVIFNEIMEYLFNKFDGRGDTKNKYDFDKKYTFNDVQLDEVISHIMETYTIRCFNFGALKMVVVPKEKCVYDGESTKEYVVTLTDLFTMAEIFASSALGDEEFFEKMKVLKEPQ